MSKIKSRDGPFGEHLDAMLEMQARWQWAEERAGGRCRRHDTVLRAVLLLGPGLGRVRRLRLLSASVPFQVRST